MELNADHLKKQALKARRLACDVTDERTKRTLNDMADECEEKAAAIEATDGGARPDGGKRTD
jgi:hypothetical protein